MGNMNGAGEFPSKRELFVCCSSSDEPFRRELESRVRSSHGDHEQAVKWNHGCVPSNGLFSDDSVHHLSNDHVIVLLVSPELIATGCCAHDPIQRAVQRHQGQDAVVIPVILRPAEWQNTALGTLPSLPSDGRPISEWPHRDEALDHVAEQIRQAAGRAGPQPDVATADLTIDLPGGHSPAESETEETPTKIGRYSVVGMLGRGAFGTVYRAHDDDLDRPVAIKVPHRRRISKPTDIEAYLNEARMVARLEHPSLVQVYDVGRTDDNLCYVVSRYVEGRDLAARLRQERPPYTEVARIVAIVADALHYAHERDLVHRDVKPANILLGQDGKPCVTDFGLAIKEEDFGKGPKRAGTPAYMSPEQARGEGHRVDGRSDIFSLGVVMYELLTGRLPFRSKKVDELLKEIARTDAKPPRQIEASIPRELERICLKAMSNRVRDRYTTAKDLAEDLWFYLEQGEVYAEDSSAHIHLGSDHAGRSTQRHSSPADGERQSPQGTQRPMHEPGAHDSRRSWDRASEQDTAHGAGLSTGRSSRRGAARSSHRSSHGKGTSAAASDSSHVDVAPARIVPKGLRAFDGNDADFFLRLLPGPRDRYGLPDTLRFWKTRIESHSTDKAFPVGLMYGPSGCGKTSLVRAGLLPRLADGVARVCVEATAEATEMQLEKKLRQLCPDVSPDVSLSELLAAVRRGCGLPREAKLLLVIDQFEQWLHGTDDRDRHGLLDALRQCDGVRIQCLLSLRVDFMMAIHRFMSDLEISIQEGGNSAPVDLFDPLHARHVLTDFGRSFGRLPDESERLSTEHEKFLDQAVNELSDDGKVIPVHLALLTEMFKGRPWDRSTLRRLGGTRGIGVTFLEETFSASTAPLEHRIHEAAARSVLRALLPVPGSDLTGRLKSRDELLAASGYGEQPESFAAVLSILDRDTRLITPAELDKRDGADAEPNVTQYFQLTHDFLVPALRDWLTRKQRETARGRAEIRLAERSELWKDNPENRRLPSAWEYLGIRTLTRKRGWTDGQRTMMRKAGVFYGWRACMVGLLLVAIVTAGWVVRDQILFEKAASLVRTVETSAITQLPAIYPEIQHRWKHASPLLESAFKKARIEDAAKLNVSLALVSLNADRSEHLDCAVSELLSASPEAVEVIRDCLARRSPRVKERLWDQLHKSLQQDDESLLRVASTLATVDPDFAKLNKEAFNSVADRLVAAPANVLGRWTELLKPFREGLAEPLKAIYLDSDRHVNQRVNAGDVLASYGANDSATRIRQLAELLAVTVSEIQFQAFVNRIRAEGPAGVTRLEEELAELQEKRLSPETGARDREKLAKRELYLALALMRLERPEKVWDKFKHTNDPRVRSYLIENISVFRVDPRLIWERLKVEKDSSARCALILSLGGFQKGQLESLVGEMQGTLKKWYREDLSAGVHGAVEWVLSNWQRKRIIAGFDKTLEPEDVSTLSDVLKKEPREPIWWANPLGQTMVVIRGPTTFRMGSPNTEVGREGREKGKHEVQHDATIPRTFAISTKEVTVEEFLRAFKDFEYDTDYSKTPDSPINSVNWYEAAAYCNWLSSQERLPVDQWCYVKANDGEPKYEQVRYMSGMQLRPDYLSCRGYRLPTETEWEYVCRAGTTTRWFFGESDELLPRYAWYWQNSNLEGTIAVGTLKPNGFGLFDVYGNIAEWCTDIIWDYAEPEQCAQRVEREHEEDRTIVDDKMMMFRGGGFEYVPHLLRSAARDRTQPHWNNYQMGFRVARTIEPRPAAP
jgi:serine/threonine protein kinase/formylglycine-generating enzyme required for sulfatase activity